MSITIYEKSGCNSRGVSTSHPDCQWSYDEPRPIRRWRFCLGLQFPKKTRSVSEIAKGMQKKNRIMKKINGRVYKIRKIPKGNPTLVYFNQPAPFSDDNNDLLDLRRKKITKDEPSFLRVIYTYTYLQYQESILLCTLLLELPINCFENIKNWCPIDQSWEKFLN